MGQLDVEKGGLDADRRWTDIGFMPVTRDLTRICLGPGTGTGMEETMVYGSFGAVTWRPVWVAMLRDCCEAMKRDRRVYVGIVECLGAKV